MKQNIFNIKNDYLALIDSIEQGDGEITEEIDSQLQITEQALEEKAINYTHVIRHFEAETKIIDEEIKRLNSIKKVRKNAIDRLKHTVRDAMITFDKDTIETPLIKLSLRKNKVVVIYDINELPKDCKVIEEKPISKVELKKRIEAGEVIPGAEIHENINLSIK